MKKKHKFLSLCAVCACAFLLSSCDYEYYQSMWISLIHGGENNEEGESSTNISIDNSNNDFIDVVNDLQAPFSGTTIKLKEVQESQNYVNLKSTGEQKVLVIPVYFSDYDLSSLPKGKSSAQVKKDIETTFFGTSEETKYWESVSSYYEKSSYGNLKISGKVSDWYNIGVSLESLAKMSSKYADPTYYVVRNAIDWYRSRNDIKEFDQDGDGYIDAVWFVYAPSFYQNATKANFKQTPSSEAQDLLWAYTYWDYEREGNVNSPIANCYAWASAHFMYNGTNNGVDAHTFIHETGHMMGLDDYYDYDKKSKLSPCGGLAMMDDNIGDHDAYSKYLLGWVTPKLITEIGDYELRSFTKTGECYLIPSSLFRFSYSAFDEYLLIEYYTPTDLNELDSKYNYCGRYPKMFTIPGIKIYHIDSRLLKVTKKNFGNSYAYTNYYDPNFVTSKTYYKIGASNTGSKSVNSDIKLINLLSSRGNVNYYSGSYAKNEDLFTNKNKLTSFEFNDGNNLNFNIEIELRNSILTIPEYATLNISQISE